MSSIIKDIDPSFFEFVAKYMQRFMRLTNEELMGLMQYCEFRKFDKKTIIV